MNFVLQLRIYVWYSNEVTYTTRTPGFLFLAKFHKLIRDSANAVPATKNYAPEIPTFGAFAGVSPTVVQWKGLILGEPPS